jgi:very-short-patch-repair endonuclease
MADQPEAIEPPPAGLPNWAAIEITKAFLKRWSELQLEEIQKDEEFARNAEVSEDPNALLDSLIRRAKWKKIQEMTFEVNKIFEKRYGDKRGELTLIYEMFGDQLSLPPMLNSDDVKQRLDWYKRRLGRDFERRVNRYLFDKSVVSPIEQIFIMEWEFLHALDPIPFTLEPQYKVPVGDRVYKVDFLVSREDSSFKLGVELDGHEFHEKSAAQLRGDKARERQIIRQGITVLRFSGSEIVRSCRACVTEVLDLMKARAEGS